MAEPKPDSVEGNPDARPAILIQTHGAIELVSQALDQLPAEGIGVPGIKIRRHSHSIVADLEVGESIVHRERDGGFATPTIGKMIK